MLDTQTQFVHTDILAGIASIHVTVYPAPAASSTVEAALLAVPLDTLGRTVYTPIG